MITRPQIQRVLSISGGVMTVLIVVAVSVMLFAPHLPRLMLEGYPQPRWPAAGVFAPVAGNPQTAAFPATGTVNDWQRQLLSESEGKVLLVHYGDRMQIAHYADDVLPETRFNSYSLAKSLIGALLLKAVAEEKISSLDDPIGRYLPDLGDEAFRATPLRAFARMRSGVATEDSTSNELAGPGNKNSEPFRASPFSSIARLHMSGPEAIADELRIPPENRGQYSYQNTNTALIGAVLAKTYGRPLQQVLANKIWRPAGAAPADWRLYGTGLPVSPYCCLYATPSDWLRVGVFLIRNGTEDTPFLPETLWRELFGAGLAPAERATGHYGLHVYHDVLDRAGEPLQGPFTYMLGSGGQIVYMMPEKDLVVVRFGDGSQLLHSTLYAAWRGMDHP